MKKHLFSFAKYSFALALIAFVLSRAEVGRIGHFISTLPPFVIVSVLIAFNVSQWFSAARLRYYYEQAGIPMTQRYALALNYAGMFYNLLLPGGVGGDAYKVYLLKKSSAFPVLQGIRIQLSNRANGLLAMLLFMTLCSCIVFTSVSWGIKVLLSLLFAIATFAIYRFCAARFLKEKPNVTWGAFRYSLGVQAMALLAAAFLLFAMHAGHHVMDYLLLFLVAAILGLLPFTVGGLGIREATFFYGAAYLSQFSSMPVDPELGVSLSLCYFAVTAFSSLPGIYCTRWLSQRGNQQEEKNPLLPLSPLLRT
ncbi:MAG: flippase-like domain-containing protein [Rickettsiales bacterium]|nr:flippase-like domain-containing protein [Rickettsiales bacterium]